MHSCCNFVLSVLTKLNQLSQLSCHCTDHKTWWTTTLAVSCPNSHAIAHITKLDEPQQWQSAVPTLMLLHRSQNWMNHNTGSQLSQLSCHCTDHKTGWTTTLAVSCPNSHAIAQITKLDEPQRWQSAVPTLMPLPRSFSVRPNFASKVHCFHGLWNETLLQLL
jgi:RNA polymerase subunit RPABC4/transcription elongation factor Spt4